MTAVSPTDSTALTRRTDIPFLERYRSFGRGIGIEILTDSLRVTLSQVRPGGIQILDSIEILRYRERPAAEWGIEYAEFLKKHQIRQLAATAVLPSSAVVSRTLPVPGVSDKEIDSAVRYQLDDLHPFAEDEARHAFARLRAPHKETLLLGIGRESIINDYATLFEEAGVQLSAFLTPAAAIYSALRVLQFPPVDQFLAVQEMEDGLLLYGETPTFPSYCVRIEADTPRAIAYASSQIRLTEEGSVHRLAALLPHAERLDVASPLSYAASLANAVPALSLPFNLLPVERRIVVSPWRWVPTIVLVILLAGLGLALSYYQDYESKRLLALLDKEAAALQPILIRRKAVDRDIAALQKRIEQLNQVAALPQQDLDALRDLTRVLPANTWLARLDLSRTSAVIAGESDAAAELLRILDSSTLFKSSEFIGTPGRSAAGKEAFQIRTQRKELPKPVPVPVAAPTPNPANPGAPAVAPGQAQMPAGPRMPGMMPVQQPVNMGPMPIVPAGGTPMPPGGTPQPPSSVPPGGIR